MTTIAGHTGAHVAPATLVAGGSVVTGVVGASRYGGAAVFASVSCRRTITVDQETKLQQNLPQEQSIPDAVPGGQVQV